MLCSTNLAAHDPQFKVGPYCLTRSSVCVEGVRVLVSSLRFVEGCGELAGLTSVGALGLLASVERAHRACLSR